MLALVRIGIDQYTKVDCVQVPLGGGVDEKMTLTGYDEPPSGIVVTDT
jgi:hypothetical protein